MLAETAYIDKTRKNETLDLWNLRLSHVSYSKLAMMMKKSMVKRLPELEVNTDVGQDLWEVVNGYEITQPEAKDANGTLQKWKIKVGKALSALKTTIEEDVLERIRDVKIPHEAWNMFAKLFLKTNDTKLQLLRVSCYKKPLLSKWEEPQRRVKRKHFMSTKTTGTLSNEWDAEALFVEEEENNELALTTTMFIYDVVSPRAKAKWDTGTIFTEGEVDE
ncbi:hypothetical protein SADUNF_Sadunf03G0027700 [Salix dunnii]|uniref:GAG-pre-integrase domain-containing protein n=1 Tax=Salix dunnii TaxID=1413687 RepID=A0A835KFY5_9ROSI|nr:hypothetical protein SADUNF_Sadunf03G0027700 [Salix dunnii]